MRLHRNAKTTPRGRAELVDRVRRQGWSVSEAAMRASVSIRTGYKWLAFRGWALGVRLVKVVAQPAQKQASKSAGRSNTSRFNMMRA